MRNLAERIYDFVIVALLRRAILMFLLAGMLAWCWILAVTLPAEAQTRKDQEALRAAAQQHREQHQFFDALTVQRKLSAAIEQAEVSKSGKPDKLTAEALGNLAWDALLAREFAEALAAADRARELAPSLLWIEANRTHALLLLGQVDAARAAYLARKGTRIGSNTDWVWEELIEEDFDSLETHGLARADMAAIIRPCSATRDTPLDPPGADMESRRVNVGRPVFQSTQITRSRHGKRRAWMSHGLGRWRTGLC